MAKIDETVFTVQIKAVNTILQLCYTLKDYVKLLIEQGNGNIDDINTINAHLLLLDNEIMQITSDITNLTNSKLSIVNSTTYAIQMYGKQPDGTQKMYDASLDAMPNSVALRNSSGAMNVADPVWPSNAATKNYCDTGDLFENIKDRNGNKRFVEDNVNLVEITGLTYDFAKWSLSGTHLMVVLAGHTTAATGFSNNQKIADVILPDYILNKIYPLYDTNVLRNASMTFVNATGGGNVVSFQISINKTSNGLQLSNVNAGTIAIDRVFRMQFDLIIDNS